MGGYPGFDWRQAVGEAVRTGGSVPVWPQTAQTQPADMQQDFRGRFPMKMQTGGKLPWASPMMTLMRGMGRQFRRPEPVPNPVPATDSYAMSSDATYNPGTENFVQPQVGPMTDSTTQTSPGAKTYITNMASPMGWGGRRPPRIIGGGGGGNIFNRSY